MKLLWQAEIEGGGTAFSPEETIEPSETTAPVNAPGEEAIQEEASSPRGFGSGSR